MRISFPKLLKIDRYVFGEIFTPFVGGIIFSLFVFLMFKILQLSDFIIVHNIPGSLVAKMTGLLSMAFLPFALPVAFLIANLVGFGRLSSDSELIAMKASGIGLRRLSLSPSALAIVVIVLSLALNLEWVPWSQRKMKETLIKIGNTKIVSSLSEGTFTTGFFDLLVYADKVDTKTNRLERVFIFDEREPKNPLTVVAREGEILAINAEDEVYAGQKVGSSAVLLLNDGNIHRTDPASDEYERIDFTEYQLFLRILEGDSSFVLKASALAFKDLLHFRNKDPRGQGKFYEYNTELWRRVGVAMSAIPFVFLGIAFGTTRTRSVRASAAAVSVVVLLSYWILQLGATSISGKGYIPAELGMQLPNLILLAVGWIAFKKAER